MTSKRPAIERFMEKVEKTETCWLWTSQKTQSGHGHFYLHGLSNNGSKLILAHRFSYEHFIGPIDDDMDLHHLCFTPSCVRPDHLQPLTRLEHVLIGNGPTAINSRKTHCVHGHSLSGDNLIIDPRGGRQCRECRREASRRRRKREQERDPVTVKAKARERNRRYYEQNRDAQRERSRQYREQNPDQVRAAWKQYSEQNREALNAAERERRAKRNANNPPS